MATLYRLVQRGLGAQMGQKVEISTPLQGVKARATPSPGTPGGRPRSAYVHIPFCRRRCFYCDFPITVLGDFQPLRSPTGQPMPPHATAPKVPVEGRNSPVIAAYMEVLLQEMDQVAAREREGERSRPAGDRLAPAPPLGSSPQLETVFFGGGTPSLLSPEQLGRVLARLDRHWGIAAGAEVAIEMDPGTFDAEKLAAFQAVGINRVSLGVQAFRAELLQACGRSHTPADIDRAIAALHTVGIANWSLDLIAGLPDQTLADWDESLAQAIALNPAHLSVYDLSVEPGTVFARRYEPGQAPLPTDETTAAMYRMASARLRSAGYAHYEISNYARPGYASRHNLTYWHNQPYYGFGMGATSYVNGVRFGRSRRRDDYRAWVAAGAMPTGTPDDLPEQLLDTLMLGLRLATGLGIEALVTRFGAGAIAPIGPVIALAQRAGWATVTVGDRGVDPAIVAHWGRDIPPHGHLQLTDPEGFLFSNEVLARLFECLRP